jgi:hypothetical protein
LQSSFAEALRALTADLHQVLGRYRDAPVDPTDDTERVTVLLQAFPSPERRP